MQHSNIISIGKIISIRYRLHKYTETLEAFPISNGL